MLEVTALEAGYGGTRVLNNLAIQVSAGEAVCLIGANGAGKSTLMHCIAGLLRPRGGRISVGGMNLTNRPAAARGEAGVALVPEGRRVFAPMTVLENLEMGAFRRLWPRRQPGVAADMAFVFDLFPRLAERRGQLAGLLSGGEQQMLAIGRALMMRPRLLLLDEPSMGLAPLVVQEIFATLKQLNAAGTAIFLAEQNTGPALASTVRGYVLSEGTIIHAGPSTALAADISIHAAYLGA
jgi:branched-chain amino acid transport system ATP-binding protein